MKTLTLEDLVNLKIIAEADDKILAVYTRALEIQELGYLDYITIRDLVSITGYNSVEIHVLLLCMFMALYDGSVCMSLDSNLFMKRLTELSGDMAPIYAKKIKAKIHTYSELIYIPETEALLFNDESLTYKPLVLVEHEQRRNLYFQKYYQYEQELYAAINRRLAKKYFYPDSETIKTVLDDILDKRPIMKNNKTITLNKKQALSLVLPLIQNLVIISGGPGTGKTSIVINLLRMFIKMGVSWEKIKVAAPTGRASQRMIDSLLEGLETIKDRDQEDVLLAGISANTIHKLLQYSPGKNGFFYNAHNQLKADIIIIDEVSMVDVELLSKLFEAVTDDARIILIGDKDQLPSVDAGAILSYLVPAKEYAQYSKECSEYIHAIIPTIDTLPIAEHDHAFTNKIVILDESYRATQQLQEITKKINQGERDIINQFKVIPVDQQAFTLQLKNAGMYRIKTGDSNTAYVHALRKVLDWWMEYHFFTLKRSASFYDLVRQSMRYTIEDYSNKEIVPYIKELFNILDDGQILTPVRKGAGGALWINEYCMEQLARRYEPAGSSIFYSGLPVMITRNDYRKELYNGDIGIILKEKNNSHLAVFNRPGGCIAYPVEMLPAFEPAYGITVHKSQGSEYNTVLLVFPEVTAKNLLTKEILYTGLTRAKNGAYIYAREDMLREAVSNTLTRESGLHF